MLCTLSRLASAVRCSLLGPVVNQSFCLSRSLGRDHRSHFCLYGTAAHYSIAYSTSPKPKSPHEPGLSELCVKLSAAAKNNDRERAEYLFEQYLQRGGEPRNWHYNGLISMHARRREAEAAMQQYERLKDSGLTPDIITFGSLLNACAKAAQPPYELPKEYALLARQFFADMVSRGIQPNTVVFNTLLNCQAKAGLLEEALSVYSQMQQLKVKPDLLTFNILILAYSKAGMPLEAMSVIEELMPETNLAPDTFTWNTLMGAFAKAGHLDGAYSVWEQMQQYLIPPDNVTERILAEAFANHPMLAAEIVAECREYKRFLFDLASLQKRNRRAASRTAAGGTPVNPGVNAAVEADGNAQGHRMLRVHRQKAVSVDRLDWRNLGDIRDPTRLDLHGLSQAAARIVLHRRLRYLQVLADGREALRQPQGQAVWDALMTEGLVIVTGSGKHSKEQGGVLRALTKEVLEGAEVPFLEQNSGRITVPGSALQQFVARQQAFQDRSSLLYVVSIRYVVAFVGIASFGAAVFVVPKLFDVGALL